MSSSMRHFSASKVPDVLLLFWIIKLLTTGIGETAAAAALAWQLRADGYHPVRYWLTVLLVALFGTMIADGPHVVLGTPYYVDSAIYLVLLAALLGWWRRSEGTIDIHSITTPRRERFYWGTVLMTFGLGTALGDTTATNLHLGYGWSTVIFGVLILVPWAAWRLGASAVVCFWAAYSLTRPLGASIADGLAASSSATPPGLGWTTGLVTVIGLAVFAALVAFVTITRRDVDRDSAVAG